MPARNDVQQFDLGQPYYLALKHTRGILCRNHSFMYSLVSGKVAFVPKEAHDEIQALHLDAGQSFKLTRIRQAAGEIKYLVDRAEPVNGNGPEPNQSPRSEEPQGHISATTRTTSVAPEHIRKLVGLATQPATPILSTPQSQLTFRQLVAAIEVVAAAEQHAIAALGRKIEFDHADIRALAISGFIEASRAA